MSKQNIYSFDLYDDQGVLQPTMILIVVILYASRYLLLYVLVMMSELTSSVNLLNNLMPSKLLALPSLLCGLLFLSLLLRKKGAKGIVKRLWSLGYGFLIASILIDFMMLSYFFVNGHLLEEVFYVVGFIDAVLVAYLLQSSYTRDVFKEFP